MAKNEDREVTQAETDALNAQTEALENLTNVAQDQYNISREQMDRYIEAFQNPTGENLNQLAEFQSTVLGRTVSPDELSGLSTEDIIRQTMLSAPAQFQREAENFIQTTGELSSKYNIDTGINTDALVKSLEDSGYKYQTELEQIKSQMGTVNQDILAQERGAATAGISQAFQEASKGLAGSLAERGLAGSGVEVQAQQGLATQQAFTTAGALQQARTSARALSDQLRMQQLGIAGQQYGAAGQTAQSIYGARQNQAMSQYGTGLDQAGRQMNTRSAATQQGIATMLQAQAGAQGQFWNAGNMMGQAAAGYGSVASGYGGIAMQQQNLSIQQQQMESAERQAIWSGIGSGIGTGIGYGIGQSDARLKENINKVGEWNGLNIYTWDWNQTAIELGVSGTTLGFIAQEVSEKFPSYTVMLDNGYLAIDYENLIKDN